MDPTPDTLNFMILGYAVIFGVMLAYLTSLWLRTRRLRQEQKMLDDLDAN